MKRLNVMFKKITIAAHTYSKSKTCDKRTNYNKDLYSGDN